MQRRRSSKGALRPAWGRTRPCSTSTTSRSISTWSRRTWSTWSSAALRSGPGRPLAKSSRGDPSASPTDPSVGCFAESSREGGEVPRGSPHALMLVHHAFHHLCGGPVGAVLLLHHVQVRRRIRCCSRTAAVAPVASLHAFLGFFFLQESTGSGSQKVLLTGSRARVRLYK